MGLRGGAGIDLRIGGVIVAGIRVAALLPSRLSLAGGRRCGVANGKKVVGRDRLLAWADGAVICQKGLEGVVLPHDPGQFRQRIVPRRRGRGGWGRSCLGELPFDFVEIDGKTGLQ
jgi:hypothetical protein